MAYTLDDGIAAYYTAVATEGSPMQLRHSGWEELANDEFAWRDEDNVLTVMVKFTDDDGTAKVKHRGGDVITINIWDGWDEDDDVLVVPSDATREAERIAP